MTNFNKHHDSVSQNAISHLKNFFKLPSSKLFSPSVSQKKTCPLGFVLERGSKEIHKYDLELILLPSLAVYISCQGICVILAPMESTFKLAKTYLSKIYLLN